MVRRRRRRRLKEPIIEDARFEKYPVLKEVLHDDFREKIFTETIKILSSENKPHNVCLQGLQLAVNNLLSISGFRTPMEAPFPLLIKHATSISKLSEYLTAETLSTWLDIHKDMREAIEEFLIEAYKYDPDEYFDDGDDSPNAWSLDQIKEAAMAFGEIQKDTNLDEVTLMVCCLTGGAPLSESEDEDLEDDSEPEDPYNDNPQDESKPPFCERLKLWMEELIELPISSQEWQEIPQFINTVTLLLEEKKHSLEDTRESLEEILIRLRENNADALAFFGFSNVNEWSSEACYRENIFSIMEALENFISLLSEFWFLKEEPTSTYTAEKEKQSRLKKLGESLVSHHCKLSSVLISGAIEQEKDDEAEATVECEKKIIQEASVVDEVTSEVKLIDDAVDFIKKDAIDIDKVKSAIINLEEVTDQKGTEDNTKSQDLHKEPTSEDVDDDSSTEGEETVAPPLELPPEQEIEMTEVIDETKDIEHSIQVPPPLRSSKEIAEALLEEDTEELWQEFTWSLIADDDLAGAIWVSRYLECKEVSFPVPSWLISAVQAARLISFNSDAYVVDLQKIARKNQPTDDNTQIFFALAAAINSVLINPGCGLNGWLVNPSCCPTLNSIVVAVRKFSNYGVALRPEVLAGYAGEAQRKAVIAEASKEVRQWLDAAPNKTGKIRLATEVWRELVAHDLTPFLSPVISNYQDNLDEFGEQLERWMNPNFIISLTRKKISSLIGRKGNPFGGSLQQQIIRRALTGTKLAKKWFDLVEEEHKITTDQQWIVGQVEDLATTVQKALPEVNEMFAELISPSQPSQHAAAAICLYRSILRLYDILDINVKSHLLLESQYLINTILPIEIEKLKTALKHRLLWLPEVSINDLEVSERDLLEAIVYALRDSLAHSRNLQEAFYGWVKKQDYRFVKTILNSLKNGEYLEFSSKFQFALTASKAQLKDEIEKTEALIEQAVSEGLSAEKRAQFNAKIMEIDLERIVDFSSQFTILKEIRTTINFERQSKLEALKKSWEELKKRLDGSHLDRNKLQQFEEIIKSSFTKEDIQVLNACFSRLNEVLDTGKELSEWRPKEKRYDFLGAFTKKMEVLEALIHKKKLSGLVPIAKTRGKLGCLSFKNLNKKEATEAGEILNTWRLLKQRNPDAKDISNLVETLLSLLGFKNRDGKKPIVRKVSRGQYWYYATIEMFINEIFTRPIPQFGSETRGRYQVVCVWERPTIDTMSALLQDLQLDSTTVLVLYLGLLSPAKRVNIARSARERELAMAVLDEVLLLFLSQGKFDFFPAFLRCALPYAAANPYTPFRAGDVPPEMFFGREEMASELARIGGSCLVYGGRQLGKSALLRHVKRQLNNPDRGQIAWVEDIKLVGDLSSQQQPAYISELIRNKLVENHIIDSRVIKPESIANSIKKYLKEETNRRIVVLFDEADNFLAADIEDNYGEVERLRTLMADSGHRFKAIFAGLHNVQRAQRSPNQPLAHFGAPQCVGPLEPLAAMRLVREPLETLGFRFSDEATVFQILSYTNYHPGLIQLFCQELLKRCYIQSAERPPYTITYKDVKAVYRISLRDRIIERFNWTLELDPRYQAIAWRLIIDQIDSTNYNKVYLPGEIMRLLNLSWFEKFGGEANLQQLRVLLDEMVDLGVLVRHSEHGKYRLRSPNLIRLMGTLDDIFDRLAELYDTPPRAPFSAENHHAPLDAKGIRYSPLTHSEFRSLNPPKFGLSSLFGSEALGFQHFQDMLRMLVPSELASVAACYAESPSKIDSEQKLKNWLGEHLQKNSKMERLITVVTPPPRSYQ